ncbi:MAG: glycosyltransferase [Fibrobacterota bacterium]
MADTIQGAKILIVNTWDNKFNAVYAAHFRKKNTVDVLVSQNHDETVATAAKGYDLVWSQWASYSLLWLAEEKRPYTLVSHIRSYEILVDDIRRIRWENVACGVFVADHIRELALEIWPQEITNLPTTVIYDSVNPADYPFSVKKPGHDIAFVGTLNHKKGLPLLLQCLRAAVDADPEYRLHVAGISDEPSHEIYLRHMITELGLVDRIIFHDYVKDIPSFLSRMDYVLSTSPWEGNPNNVIEGMAMGVKPLVHNWRGARKLYPLNHPVVFNTVDEFVSLLRSPSYDSRAYRALVERDFNSNIQNEKFDRYFAGFLK